MINPGSLAPDRAPFRKAASLLALVAGSAVMAPAPAAWADTMAPWYMPAADRAAQFAEFREDFRRTVIEFQPFRAELNGIGEDGTPLRLISLNPYVNAWFVLETGEGRSLRQWHLENAAPELFTIALSEDGRSLQIESEAGTVTCAPWEGELEAAAAANIPYSPICEQRMFLRNQGSGSRTTREAVTEFLRGYVPFGESLINLIKDTLYEDAYLTSAQTMDEAEAGAAVALLGTADLRSHPVMRSNLRVDLVGADSTAMEAGSWYAVQNAPGIYASVVQPGMVSQEVLSVSGANGLDGVENRSDVHMWAFDMSRFDLRYEIGTSHPEVDWSPRPSGAGRDYNLPGPDGFGTVDPLNMTGMLNPIFMDRLAGIFAGGFKRDHGAWRLTDFAYTNHGHHYGFVVNGVVLSRLQPGLATLYVLQDGTVQMETWSEDLDFLLPHIRFARQNGTPIIEPDENGVGVPGSQVRSWMGGNWSGSAEAQLRTLRSGVCMRTIEGRQFLQYAVFMSVTPSGMARTFQAYHCDYAMLLDMNSLDLTYSAIYPREAGSEDFDIVHLDRRMAESDSRHRDGTPMGRFIEFSDNRDFFYLLRR
ncbi:hypothetical protein [Pararhodobacter marinus]|uniref:Uncharacterized protein n=1 Tax=Pararhodobacter marinus TaxID=2184063 RepID=A0A2U2CGS0_9RHOB|nr:hypothetical protein [Pararhodobacter marinus]PWE31085.1 hypothetical protein C4N9_04890 [Pararhodobacter marinus]